MSLLLDTFVSALVTCAAFLASIVTIRVAFVAAYRGSQRLHAWATAKISKLR